MKIINTNFNRANLTESTHSIKLLIKDLNGKTLLSTGNDNEFIYPRSSIKIFQAIPFVKSGAIKNYRLTSKIIALSCSSHRGETYHLKELEKWTKKINFNKKKLKCGSHYPLNQKAMERMMRLNKNKHELHNNCAGKHLAMVSSCLMNNYDTKNYLSFSHPHQETIRKTFEKFIGNKIKKNQYGIDGCSAPQYCFKIEDISKLLINLIKSYNNNFEYSYETKLLIDSITNNPNYIGGSDSLDSRIMKITKKNIFCKGGAEGVFLFIDLQKNISGVLKVVDGNERAIPQIIHKLFQKFKIMNKSELRKFEKMYKFELFNHAKILVGSTKAIIQ